MTTMTPRERVLAACDHREPDRLPIDFGGRVTSIHLFAEREVKRLLGLEGGEEVVRSYMTYTVEPDPRLVERFGRDNTPFSTGPAAGFETVIDWQSLTYADEWGIFYRQPPGGYYFDPVGHPLASVETPADLDRYAWPDPTDPGRIAHLIEPLRVARAAGERTAMLSVGGLQGIWLQPQFLRGMEAGLLDLALNRPLAEALAERMTEWYEAFFDAHLAVIGADLDFIHIEGDLGDQSGPLFSPRDFRSIFKPRLRRVIDAIKRRSNARIWLHSCGSVYWAIPDLIDVGVEVLNPIQVNAAEMDTARLKREFGRDLTFWGAGCDPMVLQFGTAADVDTEVRQRIADLAPGGGFVFAPIHNIQANVPAENVVAMFDAARRYGGY
jgi:uroporphyrinogen decarboxylase